MNRLLMADLKRMWRQGLAISILLGCGIALFVMTNSSMLSLQRTRDQYYRDYRFADLFTVLVRAPHSLAERVRDVPGVQDVQSRIVRDVLLDIPDMVEPASCRLVSIDTREATPMNGIHLLLGRFPQDQDRSEVIVSELFAAGHGFRPGDTLNCIMGGRKQTLRIVGIGMSPEFVYVVQPGMLITDDRRFGVVWMPRRQMEAAFNMEGAFNQLSIQLQPRGNADEVILQVDRLTRPYGGTGAYDREDQISHRRVADEMAQMKTMAFVTPAIFLAVSAFLCNIVFTRLVNQQTEQIATLRAFGYRAREIGWHYTQMVMLLVSIATLIGWAVGWRLSWWMTSEYVKFFRFPTVDNQFAAGHALAAVGIGAGAAMIGTFAAIRKATRLQPAEAMRPAAPKDYRGLIAERTGLSKLLSPVGRMVVRRLETNRLATTLAVLGMGLAVAVLVLGSYMQNTIDFVMQFQFQKSQHQDVMLTFVDTMSESSIHDVMHLPGVTAAEPYRSVPVRLRNGVRSRRVGLMGLDDQPTLYRILDDHEQPVSFPVRGGLTISEKMAQLLDAQLGETVWLDILDRTQASHQIEIAKVFPNFTDPSAYLNRYQLHQLLEESQQYSGAFLSVDSDQMIDFYREVKQMPSIAGVVDKHAAEASFRETVAGSTSLMRIVNGIFSGLIALGVIYNCAIIILAERARDLATLRVMGFRRHEVSLVLLGELAVITLLAIPVGLPIGYGLSYLTTLALDTETHRFPLVIERSTYSYSTVVVIAAASLSALYVRRMLNSLDLVAVLKVKE
ncbi:FtsX-like permease family protein [Rubripirellula lacrimiformis]|uniref:FtsX-like permease family protein n=1 Tax=Rubripirellula lacrimiformis TaxID=1930273 RepID=A0A517N4P9_9BACT|nr:ABC transporter permease [Rubripirellula lacrimiformis]QDT02116.1 FtsX-like permease family protein [Rubripirellula lacrimiformis]